MPRKAITTLAAAGVLIAAFALVELYQHTVRSRAESFLLDLQALELGKSTFSDAKRLQSQYGGQELTQGIYPADCSARDCYVRFMFTNFPFAILHLAPPTGLGAALHIQGGVVRSRTTAYQAEAGDQSFVLSIDDNFKTGYQEEFCVVSRRGNGSGPPWKVQISMRPGAPKDLSNAAYALNLSCLTRFGACSDPYGMLPTLFSQKVPICTERPDSQ